MKKIIALCTAMAFALSLGMAYAQEKTETPAAPEQKAEKKAAKKKHHKHKKKKAAKKDESAEPMK